MAPFKPEKSLQDETVSFGSPLDRVELESEED